MDSRTPPPRFHRRISRALFRLTDPLEEESPVREPRPHGAEAAAFSPVELPEFSHSSNSGSFAMMVSGNSMAGRHILDGDVVIIDPVSELHEGDVVAAVIQDRTVLRTLVRHRDRRFLRADNPESSEYIPAAEIPIRGVMRTLLRNAAPRI